jgi:hypothetical protein
MKLRSLAALIFRILGALIMLGGVDAVTALIDGHSVIPSVIEVVFSLLLGWCCIFYSKKLAALFCKGLDDDDVV